MTPTDIALAYAAQGWAIFPCRNADEFDPDTGEVFGSIKQPLTPNGLKDASKSERVIRQRWDRNPQALVGGPTGRSMNAFVLDIDVKPGIGTGFDWLESMEHEFGPLPETARVATVNGGRHYYFKFKSGIKNRGNLGPLCDVRGEGGYVILPGSVLADGRRYEWLDWDEPGIPPIADAPEWLLELLLSPPATNHAPVGNYTYNPGDNAPYVESAVRLEVEELAAQRSGRNEKLNDSAYALGTLVGAGAISRSEAEFHLMSAARANGYVAKDGEKSAWQTMSSGLAAGILNPRVIPDRAEQAVVQLYSQERIDGILRKVAERNAAENIKPDESLAPEERPAAPAEPAAPKALDITKKAEPITASAFSWIDPKTLPRRSFAFGVHYIRKYVSVTVAPGGLGKTANSIVDALAMISGRSLAGEKPSRPLKCWIFNCEDPRDEMSRRIMGAALYYNMTPEQMNGHLFLDTGREQELVIAHDDKRSGVKINVPVVDAIISEINRHGIDVMIVDPFVSTHSVNENDNGSIDKVAKMWALIADKTNCSIDIVHHLRKVSDREATVEDARGAVSLIGAARSVRVLNRMTEDQATAGGLNPADRFGYFSVTYGKSNLTPLSHKANWRKLVSQDLGNGGKGALAFTIQDSVPVVTEWKWPGSEEIVGALTDDQTRHIKALLDSSDYKAAANSKAWAGDAVAFALGLDGDDKANKARCTGILKAMLKDGLLAEVRERDPISRKDAAFIRSAEYAASVA